MKKDCIIRRHNSNHDSIIIKINAAITTGHGLKLEEDLPNLSPSMPDGFIYLVKYLGLAARKSSVREACATLTPDEALLDGRSGDIAEDIFILT